MSLKGDLQSISLASLLQIIEAERKSGVLTLHYQQFQKKLFLKEGLIAFLVSDDPKDFFGHFLIRHEIITESILAQALRIQGEQDSKQKIGEILTLLGKLPIANLREQLQRKLEESVYELFLLTEAQFDLQEVAIEWTDYPDLILLPVRDLLMEGIRRYDEFQRLRADFPTSRQSFLVDRSKIGGELNVSGGAARMLELLEKGSTIEDLCLQAHANEYAVLRQLLPFLKKGLITKGEVKPENQASQPQPVKLLMDLLKEARSRGDWGKCVEVCTDILKLDPGHYEARSILPIVQGKLVSQVLTKDFPKKAIPSLRPNVDFSNRTLSTTDGFVLSRVNGIWSIGEILSVVPIAEAEVLMALKKLKDLGFLEIKVPP